MKILHYETSPVFFMEAFIYFLVCYTDPIHVALKNFLSVDDLQLHDYFYSIEHP